MNRTRRNILKMTALVAACLALAPRLADAQDGLPATQKTNILMIAVDDLNDWVGTLQGHPQTKTPHMDRLAKQGINFTHAHCPIPLCNPSRASIMTGVLPSTTGVYGNMPTVFNEPLPTYWDRDQIVTMGEYLGRNGFKTLGVGKIFHQCKWQATFQEYGPPAAFQLKPNARIRKNVPDSSKGSTFDFGPIPDAEERQYMSDIRVADWAVQKLGEKHDRPFFLAVGFVKPHIPLVAPQRYFDRIGKESEIQLPPRKDDDLADLPKATEAIARYGGKAYYDTMIKDGDKETLRGVVHAYLACIAFVDEQIGRVLDALERSPYAKDTLIVLWSDHGFHLGEKQRIGKQTLWQRSSRTPFMVAGPGVKPGTICAEPTSLLSVFPTINDYLGLPRLPQFEGPSLLPQLTDPQKPTRPVLVTCLGENPYLVHHAAVSKTHRYIRYADGGEELYDLKADPNEWQNLAVNPKPEQRALMDEMAAYLPKVNAPIVTK